MPGFLERCERLFGTKDIYEIFDVQKTATEQQIKKAYYKISLKTHPDRSTEKDKEKATQLFQLVGNAYCILSDKEKRAVYDETGEVPDDSVDQDRNWDSYWRLLFKKITVEDITKFKDQYQGSKEELDDIKKSYEEGQGDMDHIMQTVLCVGIDDEPRIRKILQDCIKSEELEAYKAFTNESKAKANKRRKHYEREAEEAAEIQKELGVTGGDSLESAILLRQKSREQELDSFCSHLEAKYCQPKQKGKKVAAKPSENKRKNPPAKRSKKK